jgi:Tol biopolymer transport system component
MWEAATGNRVHISFYGNTSASFSPDGRWLVCIRDGNPQVWEAATRNMVGYLLHHIGVFQSASFSPDGLWLVTVSAENAAQVWEAASGMPVGQSLYYDGIVQSASFSPDGRWLVTVSAENAAQVWEAATGKSVGQLLQHGASVRNASFSPDGQRVVPASEDTARLWEMYAPDNESRVEWRMFLSAVGGQEVASDGAARKVSGEERLSRLNTLKFVTVQSPSGCR